MSADREAEHDGKDRPGLTHHPRVSVCTRMRLTYDDLDRGTGKSSADTDEVEVSFVRLVKDRRIEQAVTFDSEDPRFSGVMRVTWTFRPAAQGTEVSVRCENVPEGISPEDHAAGLRSTLENLAKFTE